MKPAVFIGSSSEGLPVAYALQNNLEQTAEITVWDQDAFRASEFILESLLKQLDIADFGIFVFSQDDIIRIRGQEHATVRDNVIFEFGLFVGRLGRENSIIVSPKSENPRLPSDLLGVNVLKFQESRADGNLDAALGPASNKIKRLLKRVQLKINRYPPELELPIMERRDLLSATQRALLEAIESADGCSAKELAGVETGILRSELHYRMEQLRLLMFINTEEVAIDGGETEVRYSLSEPYKMAREARSVKLLGTDDA